MSNQIKVSEQSILIPTGYEVEVDGIRHKFTQDLSLNYIDWQGARAGVYVKNPLRDSFIPFPPNLEDGDVTQYAAELAQQKDDRSLKLGSDEVKEKDTLASLLMVA